MEFGSDISLESLGKDESCCSVEIREGPTAWLGDRAHPSIVKPTIKVSTHWDWYLEGKVVLRNHQV
jgi:hypothetical protein